MGHILVVGSVNVDRVWWLNGPLCPGGRLTYRRRELRCGGGGFNTGAALLALGHEVTLVASLAEDAAGHACLRAVRKLGFDVSHVTFRGTRTRPLDIFVDTSGERTIMAPAATERPRVIDLPRLSVDAVYVNVRRIVASALSDMLPHTKIIAQVPLEAGERRPASVLIGATSDGRLVARQDILGEARRIGGDALAALVLTDGARGVRIYEDRGETRIEVAHCPTPPDTTGAGDAFAAGYIDAYMRGASPVEAARHGTGIAAQFLLDRSAFGGSVPLHLDPEDLLAE